MSEIEEKSYKGDCPKCEMFVPLWYPADDKNRAACPYCMTRVHVSKLEAYTEDDDQRPTP